MLIVIFASFLLVSSAQLAHSENQPSLDLAWPQSIGNREVGFSTIEDFSNDWQSFSRLFTYQGSEILCASIDDPYCTARSGQNGIQLLQILPPCKTLQLESDCIDGLQVSDGKVTKDSQLLKVLPYSHFSAVPSRGIPEGGAPSLWSNPFSSDPAAGLEVITSGYMTPNGTNTYQYKSFATSIKSFVKTTGNYKPLTVVPASADTPGSTGYLSYTGPTTGCIWTDVGLCGVQTSFTGIKTLTLKMKLSNTQTGWLAGRLQDPEIIVDPISSLQNEITITGAPAIVAETAAKVSADQATNEMKAMSQHGYEFRSFDINDLAHLIDLYKSQTRDSATKMIPTWSVTNGYGQSTNSCLQSNNSFVGLVTSNAAAYQTNPPEYSQGALNYSLASPHFQPNGEPFEGTYDLLLSSTAARCLYKFSQAPISASVSILNDDGTNQVVTHTLQESGGWLKLDIKGFHFSQPTISVRLTQESKTQATPTAEPIPSQPQTLSQGQKIATAPTPKRQSTIVCYKGKIRKLISGIKPTCPFGYRK